MFELAWPWMLALLPLPLLAWWWLPPYRARQASVQVPFFDRLAAATGQTPQRGAVVLQRRRVQMIGAVLIWILIVAALARPQWVGELSQAGALVRNEAIGYWWAAVPKDSWPEDEDLLARIDKTWHRLWGEVETVRALAQTKR